MSKKDKKLDKEDDDVDSYRFFDISSEEDNTQTKKQKDVKSSKPDLKNKKTDNLKNTKADKTKVDELNKKLEKEVAKIKSEVIDIKKAKPKSPEEIKKNSFVSTSTSEQKSNKISSLPANLKAPNDKIKSASDSKSSTDKLLSADKKVSTDKIKFFPDLKTSTIKTKEPSTKKEKPVLIKSLTSDQKTTYRIKPLSIEQQKEKDKPGIVIIVDSLNKAKDIKREQATLSKAYSKDRQPKDDQKLTIEDTKPSKEDTKPSKDKKDFFLSQSEVEFSKFTEELKKFSQDLKKTIDESFNQSIESDQNISKNKKENDSKLVVLDPLEKIKNKLEEQTYLKQEKPSDYESLSQHRRNSIPSRTEVQRFNQDNLNQKESASLKQTHLVQKYQPEAKNKLILEKSQNLDDSQSIQKLENVKLDADQLKKVKSPPKIKLISKNDKKEINIKGSQNMRANLSLGADIKAEVEDRESHTKINKLLPSEDKNEDDQQSDWGSISIQLDITKDPKTNKIEISEDVKVLPYELKDNFQQKKEETKKQAIQETHLELTKSLEQEQKKDKELLKKIEIEKKERLKQKPSITHYVKANNREQLEKDRSKSEYRKEDKFERYYSQDTASESKSSTSSFVKLDNSSPDFKRSKPKSLEAQSQTSFKMDSDQAVVLYKADTDSSDKQSLTKEDSDKCFKKLSIFRAKNDDKKNLAKKVEDDMSSEEQTYEQVIQQKYDLLKVHFPNLNISPPPLQPTPPPFHLKLTNEGLSKDTLKDVPKSEELTYHEQKEKFSLKSGKNDIKEISIKESKLESPDLKLTEKKSLKNDYENIKKLDLPSEKKAELELEKEPKYNEIKPNKSSFLETNKSDESDKSLDENLEKKELKNLQKAYKIDNGKDNGKDEKGKIKLSEDSKKLILNLEKVEDDQNQLISKFNNEIERLKRLERYLLKMKGILSNENSSSNIKKRILKRLILIKKDLNRLTNLCEELLYENNLRTLKRKYKKKQTDNRLNDSGDSSDDEDSEILKKSTLGMIREEVKKNLLERKLKQDQFIKTKLRKRIKNDFNKGVILNESMAKDDYRRFKKDEYKKDNHHKEDNRKNYENFFKEDIKSTKQDHRSSDIKKINKKARISNQLTIRDQLIKSFKKFLNSFTFKIFLVLLIFFTFIFSYCYYKRITMVNRRFPCKLKRKNT